MANMFVPEELDGLVKERANQMRGELDDVDYVPEWQALVSMLSEDELSKFLDRHGDELSAIDTIAESTGESIENPEQP